MAQTENKLIYVGDPMCSWCYGFSPEFSAAYTQLKDQVSLQMIMGGLRPYNTETMADLGEFLREHWQDVSERSGQPFNYEILSDVNFVYDTEPPSRAVLVVRRLQPESELAFFKAIQSAFYRDNHSTHELATYQKLAQGFGIDPDDFARLYQSDELKDATREDFQAAARLGVRSFPTVVLQKGEEYFLIAQGYLPAEQVVQKVEQVLSR